MVLFSASRLSSLVFLLSACTFYGSTLFAVAVPSFKPAPQSASRRLPGIHGMFTHGGLISNGTLDEDFESGGARLTLEHDNVQSIPVIKRPTTANVIVFGTGTSTTPKATTTTSKKTTATPQPTAAIPAPKFVVYSDEFVPGSTGPPDVSQVKGFNVFILSFLLTEGAFDKAEEWTQLTPSQRSAVISQYHAAGVQIIVSLFGSTDIPTTSGADPNNTADTMASWVIEFGLDGVDIDYEDFAAMDRKDGSAEAWIVTFTKRLRTHLPLGQFILTHAPVAPWFSIAKFTSGAYLTVDKEAGNLIDWYNVQFYNQGAAEYTTCTGLLTASSSAWPKSSLFEIAASGVSLNKLVIGKPAVAGDASNGFIDPVTLAGCVSQAKAEGWNGGVMTWEFPHGNAAWIKTVRGSTFPV